MTKKPLSLILLAAALLIANAADTYAQGKGEIAWQGKFPQRVAGKAVVMWNPYPGAIKYVLTRKEKDGGVVISWETNQNYYVDERAERKKTYNYTITAIGSDQRPLAVSQTKTLEADIIRIPKISNSYQEDGKIFIIWNGDANASFHNVYRSEKGGKEPKKIASVRTDKYIDANVLPNQKYTYFIKSVDKEQKETEPSNYLEVSVQPWEGAPQQGPVQRRYLSAVGMIIGQTTAIFSEPTDMVFRRGKLFVTDIGSRTVQEIATDGTFIRKLGKMPANYPYEWGIPWGIDSDAEGRVFAVTYMKTPRVRIFDRNGYMLLDMVIPKPKEMEDHPLVPQPMDVLLDGTGGFWVTEYSYGQLIHFDEKGVELQRIGVPKFLEEGGPFKTPTFLMRQPSTGEMWVSESLQGRIYRVSPEGAVVGYIERKEGEYGVLMLPKGLGPGEAGETLVVDGMLGSLQSFDEKGNLVAVYYTDDMEYLELPSIVAQAFDPATGDIYLSSKIESAIFKLQLVDFK